MLNRNKLVILFSVATLVAQSGFSIKKDNAQVQEDESVKIDVLKNDLIDDKSNFKSLLNSETLIFFSAKTFLIFLSVSNLFSLSFQILEFSLNEQLLRKNNAIKVKINLFTQVSVQSSLCLKPYIWI